MVVKAPCVHRMHLVEVLLNLKRQRGNLATSPQAGKKASEEWERKCQAAGERQRGTQTLGMKMELRGFKMCIRRGEEGIKRNGLTEEEEMIHSMWRTGRKATLQRAEGT